MKKIIYTLIAAFVACTAVAQTPSAYFMEGSTFRSQLNPAFAPLRGYVNIPVLGGVQVNVSGNLSVSDIFYPVNGSLVTLFDKNVSAAEALGNLRSKNMLGTDARINIIIRKSKCSTDFKRNDFLKKNEAYPLGALRSLKFAYRKLRISLFVELAV